MLRLTRKFLRFEPGPNLSTEVLGNALKAVPMSLEPCNLAGKGGAVKEFVWDVAGQFGASGMEDGRPARRVQAGAKRAGRPSSIWMTELMRDHFS
jgi:hypothetical protein